MPARLSPPVTKTFALIELDPTGETVVTVRKVSQGAIIAAGDAVSQIARREGDGASLTQIYLGRIQMIMCYHAIVACNILAASGRPLFPSRDGALAMTQNQFEEAWKNLFPEWAREIYECVLEVNPL